MTCASGRRVKLKTVAGSHEVSVLLLDGGLGTTLDSEPYNAKWNEKTPLWSSHLLLSSPETLVAVHKAFATAGADIVLTATYQASYEGFARTPRLDSSSSHGYDKEEAAAYMRKAVKLVAQSQTQPDSYINDSKPAVALSLGAYGAILSPSQEFSGLYPEDMTSEHALYEWHKDRLQIFRSDANTWRDVEYVAFETVRPLAEVRGIRRAAVGLDKKWWISHVVPDDVKSSNIPAVIETMLAPEDDLQLPWGIGVNCTAVSKLEEIERLYRQTLEQRYPALTSKIWLVLYPDGTQGEVYDTKTMTWVKKSEQNSVDCWEDIVAKVVQTAKSSGVWKGIIVGGCCKTLPKDIKRLRTCLNSVN